MFKLYECISGMSWAGMNSNSNIQICYALHIQRVIDKANGINCTNIEEY